MRIGKGDEVNRLEANNPEKRKRPKELCRPFVCEFKHKTSIYSSRVDERTKLKRKLTQQHDGR